MKSSAAVRRMAIRSAAISGLRFLGELYAFGGVVDDEDVAVGDVPQSCSV